MKPRPAARLDGVSALLDRTVEGRFGKASSVRFSSKERGGLATSVAHMMDSGIVHGERFDRPRFFLAEECQQNQGPGPLIAQEKVAGRMKALFLQKGNAVRSLPPKHPFSHVWCLVKLAYLTEIAALMAAHGRLFIEQNEELPAQTIGDYYILSRNRFNRWMKDLSDLENGLSLRDPLHMFGLMPSAPATRTIAEQILVNEMVARVWTILMMARDRYQNVDMIRPVAHNVFLGHLSVRHKALSVVLQDDRLQQHDLLAIDKLRKATERWTDLLCCGLMNKFDLWQYAFHEDVAKEFLRDRTDLDPLDHRSRAWVLVLAGMRHNFQEQGGLVSVVHDDDRRLTRLMLNSFPDDAPEMTFWMSSRVREAKRC